MQLRRTRAGSGLTFMEYTCGAGGRAVDARAGNGEGPPSRGAGLKGSGRKSDLQPPGAPPRWSALPRGLGRRQPRQGGGLEQLWAEGRPPASPHGAPRRPLRTDDPWVDDPSKPGSTVDAEFPTENSLPEKMQGPGGFPCSLKHPQGNSSSTPAPPKPKGCPAHPVRPGVPNAKSSDAAGNRRRRPREHRGKSPTRNVSKSDPTLSSVQMHGGQLGFLLGIRGWFTPENRSVWFTIVKVRVKNGESHLSSRTSV